MGKWRYGVILDAGSSGTRLHIYRWLNNARARQEATIEELHSLPVIQTKKSWTKKIKPGVSTFGDRPTKVGPEHLAPLIEHAKAKIPKHEIENTPFFLLATAGMRLLPDVQQKSVLGSICTYVGANTNFVLPDCNMHVQVISGDTEGLYGWIAANYLLGGFDRPSLHDHGKGHHTYGFLDMGGASAQIAFAPNQTESAKHAEDLKLLRLRTVDGAASEYKVFTTTWLGFGAHQARGRYVAALEESMPDTATLPDPCLPAGLEVKKNGHVIAPGSSEDMGKEPHLVGTGRWDECLKKTYPLLGKDMPCPDEPCLINGAHVPTIDFDVNHFVGVSEYWHTTHEVFEMDKTDKAYDLHTYQERVVEFCSKSWSSIEEGIESHRWGDKVDESSAAAACFKASWLISMLHSGIGIPRMGLEDVNHSGVNSTKEVIDKAKEKGYLDPFQAVNKINGTEVSWTLGKIVLYAASQIPPNSTEPSAGTAHLNPASAVGFGTNTRKGVPVDFQFAGGRPSTLPNDLKDNYDGPASDEFDDDRDWHEALFHSNSSRRIPGFVFFLLIMCLIVFLMCGRDRRSALYRKFFPGRWKPQGRGPRRSGTVSKRRRGFAAKLLGGGSPDYERVLEGGGDELEDLHLTSPIPPEEFEDFSDSSEGSKTARTSGWATPQLQGKGATPASAQFHNDGFSPISAVAGSHAGAAAAGMTPRLGLGLSQNAFEKSGLSSRSDSREKLALGPGVLGKSKSRPTSPTRLRSPGMMPLKEVVD
ncbi:MAG: Golgi apyrase [Bogoriella megaspora]|nr:MAG: Golgi apyrase [Bogoriella megaspora]